jgi:hypothetical protein
MFRCYMILLKHSSCVVNVLAQINDKEEWLI